ncbi:MAG: hypothetical protein P8P30_07970 [Rickettsiales bacterium]|nr:hypothetical protein [Rickettsiales bacterium]
MTADISPHTGWPIVHSLGAGRPMNDRRFPSLDRFVSLDENNVPHLTITLPPVENEELETAIGLSPAEISRKYMEALAERMSVAYGTEASISVDEGDGRIGVTVPLDYDLSEYRDALLYEDKRLMALGENKNVAELVYFETVKRELADAFTFAKYDLVNAIPPQDLQNTAQTALYVLESKKEQGKKSAIQMAEDLPDLLKKLSDSPETVDEIVAGVLPEGVKIPEGGVKFSLAGTGRSGIFLKTDIPEHGEIVVGLRTGRTVRAMNPTQLQALKQFKAGEFWIEVSPALDTKRTTPEHLSELKHGTSSYVSPKGQKYYINDPEVRNIGLAANGKPYYLDGDGISPDGEANPAAYQGVVQTQWVREDGSWEQYHDFQAMHQTYDSPLHQQGGKLTSAEKASAPTNTPQPLTQEVLQNYVAENVTPPADFADYDSENIEIVVRDSIMNWLSGLSQKNTDFEKYFGNLETLDDIETIVGRLQPEMVAFETQRRASGVDMHTTADSWVQPRLIEHLKAHPRLPTELEMPKPAVIEQEEKSLPNGWETTERYSSTKGSLEFINPKFVSESPENRAVLAKGAKWKLHINVPDNRNDPLTKEITDYLLTRNDLSSFKIGVGDEDFLNNGNQPVYNGMTVYVGSHDEARKVAEEVSTKFANKLQEYENGKAPGQEMYVLPGISMRFDAKSYAHAKNQDGDYQSYGKYGAGGISELSSDAAKTRFCNQVLNSGGKYPFEGKEAEQVATYERLAKLNMDRLVDEFGDYLLGEDATQKYLDSGRKIEALPQWANDWCSLKWKDMSSSPSVIQQNKETAAGVTPKPVSKIVVEPSNPAPPKSEPESPKVVEPPKPATDTADKSKSSGFTMTKALVTLGATGTALFVGKNKEPEERDPDAPKPNWFQRNFKTFLKIIGAAIAIDVGLSMATKHESYTMKAGNEVVGKFTAMLAGESNSTERKL